MARIRTIKPEFWDSPDTASASAVARLLFIAMWNWADDAGRGPANLKELEGFAFPNDDVTELSGGTSESFRHVLAEVRESYDVLFFKVRGRPFYEIPSWRKHQRNERTAKGKHPSSDEGEPWDFMVSDLERGGTSDNLRHVTAEVEPTTTERQTTSGPGTGEQGNRGTGEEPPASPSEPAAEGRLFDVDEVEISTSTDVAVPEPVNGGAIVAALIDACRAKGIELPQRLIGQYGKTIKGLLVEKYTAQQIWAALSLMAEENVLNRPSLLTNKIVTVQSGPERAPARAARSTTDDRFNGWLNLDLGTGVV